MFNERIVVESVSFTPKQVRALREYIYRVDSELLRVWGEAKEKGANHSEVYAEKIFEASKGLIPLKRFFEHLSDRMGYDGSADHPCRDDCTVDYIMLNSGLLPDGEEE